MDAKMSFGQFVELAEQNAVMNARVPLTRGQAYWGALRKANPRLAASMQHGGHDPWNDDRELGAFLSYVHACWDWKEE